MTTDPQKLKDKLGQTTEQVEKKTSELLTNHKHYYSDLEPWQRGLLLISLTLFLLFSIYYLTKKEPSKPRELTDQERKQIERSAEERILKRAEFLRRLQG